MASLKGNVILNGINTVTGIIFPVITFPYAARVLLPDGIGAINFLNSIVGYIVLFTCLGIPMYAVKEIATCRNDKVARDRTTIEILLLSVILCAGGYVVVWLLAKFVPEIHAQATLFYVLSLTILFTSIGVNWFYQGIEDFKFITIRALIVRILAAAALFIFVHSPSDLLIYGFIIVGSTVGNNFINFIHLRKHIDLSPLRHERLNVTRHIKPSLQVFTLTLIISLYAQLNSITLGFISGDESVGFFTAGTRISHIGLVLISSVGAVMLPRCSHLIKEGKMDEFKGVIGKSLGLTQIICYPMAVGLIVLAVPLTIVFCGPEYYDSIPVLLLNAPVVIFISLSSLMCTQILYPMDKIKIVIYSVSVGAILNLALNFVLIPPMQATGAALSTLIAEFGVLAVDIILGKSYFPFSFREIINMKYIVASVVMGVAVVGATFWLHHHWLQLLVGIPVGIIVYACILSLIKDSLFGDMSKMIIQKIPGLK